MCDEYLHLCKRPQITELSAEAFVERVLSDKPAANDFIDNLYKEIANDPNPRKIRRGIHFSDPHPDFYYQVGAPSKCGKPICCRDNGPDDELDMDSPKAGKWGDYNCDIPTYTLQNMFEFIANNQEELQTDFITWTGDNSAHNTWNNSNEEVT